MADTCPVCKSELKSAPKNRGMGTDATAYECSRCGNFSLTGSAFATLPTKLLTDELAATKLSHVLYSMTEREPWPVVDSGLLKNILLDTSPPGLSEQLSHFVQWLATNQPTPGASVPITQRTHAAIGAQNDNASGFVIEHAVASGLVDGAVQRVLSGKYIFGPMKLTFKGWGHYEEVRRGNSAGRTAFMAMQFGDQQLDAIYMEHFKAAVAATGFQLKRNDEAQKAGLIDDHMRVEIRQSRFLIADLTDHNRGAYWEAGFAEGLGKPVIYTCRADAFENGDTHFDTNHHLTVKWDPDNMEEAVEKLKATIRATLPGEAKLSD